MANLLPIKVIKNIEELKSNFNYSVGLQTSDFKVKGNKILCEFGRFSFEFSFPLNIITERIVNVGQKGELIHRDIAIVNLGELCAVNEFKIYYDNKKVCKIKYLNNEVYSLDEVFKAYTSKPILPRFEIKGDILLVPVDAKSIIIKDGCAHINDSDIQIEFLSTINKIRFCFKIPSKQNDKDNFNCILAGVNIEDIKKLKYSNIQIVGTLDDFIMDCNNFGLGKNEIAIKKAESKENGAYIAKRININMQFIDENKLSTNDIILLGYDENNQTMNSYKVDKLDKYDIIKLNTPLDTKIEDKKLDIELTM